MPPETSAVVRAEESQIAVLLADRTPQLLELIPSRSAAERFKRVTLQALIRNPRLMQCRPETVLSAVFEAAAVGLEPTGGIGGAHLVPYRQKDGSYAAQLIYDYRGVVDLITRRPSDVLSVEAVVVKEGDEFSYERGTKAFVRHVPSLDANRSAKATTHVYAIARLREGDPKFDLEDRAGIERVRRRSRASTDGPWVTDWDEMAKKTIVKRLAKLLPIRPEVRGFLAREDESTGEAVLVEPPKPAGPTKAAQLGARLRQRRETPAAVDLDGQDEEPPSPAAPPAGQEAADDPDPDPDPQPSPAESQAHCDWRLDQGGGRRPLACGQAPNHQGDHDWQPIALSQGGRVIRPNDTQS